MEFTYNAASPGVWNPATHSYDDAGTASWTCDEGANIITVTNHSNTGITVVLSYEPEEGYDEIAGNFSKSSIILVTAVGTLPAEAPTDSSFLTLSGTLDSGTAEKTKIGTVTVTLP